MALRRKGTAVLTALLLVVFAACSDDDDSPTVTPDTGPATTVSNAPVTGPATGTVLAVTVRGGTVEGASRQRAPLNQPVIIRVTSDVADEVHVHGYDKRANVSAGGTTELRFDANIPGVFEVEFERAHKLLFTMEVR